MKYNKLQESFLIKYFCLDTIISAVVADMEKVYYALAKIYCINDADFLKYTYTLTFNEDILAVDSYDEYERTMRILDYEKRCGREVNASKDVLQLLNCKGYALEQALTIKKSLGTNPSKSLIISALSRAVESQSINMLSLVSFISYEGIVVTKDISIGFDLALKCAKWNDIDGILILLSNDTKNAKCYLSMLNTILNGDILKDSYQDIFKKYAEGDENELSEKAAILANYIKQDKVIKGVYDPQIVRIVYSNVLSIEDKKHVIFSGSKEIISSVNDLPLGSGYLECPVPKQKLNSLMSLKRPEEIIEVEICLRGQIKANKARPLLLISEDKFVRVDYSNAIRNAYGDILFKKLSAKRLTKMDLAPTKDNFVVSTLMNANASSGVFVIEDIESLNDELIGEFVKLLQYESKSQFKMQEPRVTLNLENCVFILISSKFKINGQIKSLCQVIEAENINEAEKDTMINKSINDSKEFYDCGKLFFDENAIKALRELESEQCQTVIEKICRRNAYSEVDNIRISGMDINANTTKKESELGFVIRGGRR